MTDDITEKHRFYLQINKMPIFGANGLPIVEPWRPSSWNAEFIGSLYGTIVPAIEATQFYSKTKFGFFEASIRFGVKDQVNEDYQFKSSKDDGIKILTVEKRLCWEDNANNDAEQWRRVILQTVGQMLIQVCKKYDLSVEPISPLLDSRDLENQETVSISESVDTSKELQLHFSLSDNGFGNGQELIGMHNLADHLADVLEDLSVATYDGEEVGAGFFTVFLRSDNPTLALEKIIPTLEGITDIRRGSYAVITGGDKDEKISLGPST